MTETHRLHVLVEGRVQGVGYRYAASARAVALGLRGWVRNLPDGRVEGEFEGAPEALDSMLDWCGEGPGFARVTAVQATREHGEPRYQEFRVRY